MSNYNAQLQSNNTDLQKVLQTLYTKAAGSGEAVEWSANEDAIITGTLSNYFNNRVISIRPYTFYECSNLTTVSFPAATSIDNYAFYNCSRLTTISFPVATSISDAAFRRCSNLITANFPAATSIGDYVFQECSSLTTVNFPVATDIGTGAFYECSRLTTANIPAATSIDYDVFYRCYSLTTANFPAATSIGSSAFYNCSRLTTISFPVATSIGNDAFCYCYSLTTVSFPEVRNIGRSAFYWCTQLTNIILAGKKIPALSHSNAFSVTNTKKTFYVPSSMIQSYKTATNWAYYSSYFSAIESYPEWDGNYGIANTEIITFTIDGIEYQGESTMTWVEWCDSEYNTIELKYDSDGNVGTYDDEYVGGMAYFLSYGEFDLAYGGYEYYPSSYDLITNSSEYYLF